MDIKSKKVTLLLDRITSAIGQVDNSILLTRIEESSKSSPQSEYGNHCLFSKDGGGTYVNICRPEDCYSENEVEVHEIG